MASAEDTVRRWLGDPRIRYGVDLARAVLAVVLVAQLAVGLWHLTLPGDLPSLLGALRTGQVSVLEIGEAPDARAVDGRASEPTVRWRTVDGRWHAFSLYEAPSPSGSRHPTVEQWSGRVPEDGQKVVNLMGDAADVSVARTVAWAYLSQHHTVVLRSTTDNPLQWWLDVGSDSVWLITLLVLVAAPPTRRATKWAWFWLFWLHYGIGLLAYLAMETPWARPRPSKRRLSGWRVFFLVNVAMIGLSMASIAVDLL